MSDGPITRARFAALAETYGGVIARWPAAVRDAAQAMARDPACADLLAAADALDARLDAWRVAEPAAGLADRVRAGAPRARLWARRRSWWWPGIGIATALAGAAAGSVAVSAATPAAIVSDDMTAFGDLAEG